MKETKSFKIIAVGDIALGNEIMMYWKKNNETEIQSVFKYTQSILKTGDFVFGNLEGVLSNNTIHSDLQKYALRSNPKFVEYLKNAGFNVLNVLNNHSYDHGTQALIDTVNAIMEIGIIPIGSNREGMCNPSELVPFEVNSLRIGILSFCLNIGTLKCPNIKLSINQIENIIQKSRKSVDLLIVSLHWGYEYVSLPSAEQIDIAHRFVDAGANIILGHHPHVLQPIEKYKEGIVVYSLGNFVFNQRYQITNYSTILEIEILGKKIEIHSYSVKIQNGVPKIIGKRIPSIILSEKELRDRIREDYHIFAKKENKKYKISLYIGFIIDFWKYDIEWYRYMIQRKIKKRK